MAWIENQKLEIPLNKKPFIWVLVICLLMCAGGLCALLDYKELGYYTSITGESRFSYVIAVTDVVSSVCLILIFGGLSVHAILKLCDKRPGLVITAEGFCSNNNIYKGLWVSWQDVETVEKHKYSVWTRIKEVLRPDREIAAKPKRGLLGRLKVVSWIGVYIKDPQAYPESLPTPAWRKKIIRAAYELCGTPIIIGPSVYKISFDELYDQLAAAFAEYQKRVASNRHVGNFKV